ncbi:transglutaminaseTgpA domain-containing protein [Streptomyces sp. 549]|uniref:transglutaminaseTgpA domain-containing protein n=1 Tax=Streptomyces sp. 549 TaxID=3049076 RepID=UPI0024C277DA|nr:transglutaminaseTgpA domain-containing protein [Streptomyces sp. 549]MDK1475585.1 transglutaminaseTgpA domain-containing protein [Streptomyces sp. 549]
MSGRAILAACSWLATLAAAAALLPLVTPAGWMVQAALLLAVQTLVGVGARRIPLARPLVLAAQAAVSVLLITLVFTREVAFAGVIPGPDSVQYLGVLLSEGADDVGRFAIPAPVTEGIRLLLVGGVLAVGLLVDALAVTFRSAAPAGLPLLALYSVAAGLSPDGASWAWFLCAAGGYLVLLLAEGRDRLSQWGQVFSGGTGPHDPALGGPVLAPVRTGRRIGAASLGLALLVPALLPSLNSGLLDPAGRSGGGSGGGTVSAVNPLVSLQDSLNQPENRTVLTYESDATSTQDLYLRIVALDQFDGTSWKPSERRIQAVPRPLPQPPGLSSDVDTDVVTTRIAAADWYAQNWLPMPYPARQVDIDGRWRFEPVGRTLVGDRGQTTKGVRYQVESLQVRPTAAQLAEAPQPQPGMLREYTAVPPSLPDEVRSTARRVTAGSANHYERALALQEWFAREGGFTYNTEVRAGTGSSAIARFLEQKEGFCVHFAFSMAAMSRTLGIPARVAVGFTPGTSDGETTRVGLQDAHAWPELYFEGVGWTRFEPTPSRGSTPGYAQPDLPEPGAEEPALPEPEQNDEPEAQPAAPEDCPPELRRMGECGEEQQDADAAAAGGGFPWQPVLLGAGALLVLVLLPLLPLLWRVRARSRRIGAGAARLDPAGRTLAAWREMLDAGWDRGVVPDESETPRAATARLVESGRLGAEPAAAAGRLAAAVEQVLYAPEPRTADGLADDVRRVEAGLRESADRRGRLRALLLPRSAVRVLWSLSDRWTAFAQRQRVLLGRVTSALRPGGTRA